jgi:O-acetyl-ADP-ribose deacetylase (regulator of RNase III)
MRILLVYRDADLGNAWKQEFADISGVEIVAGDITDIDCDAIVSPANSFGFMDGGLDLDLSDRFGWDLQDRLQGLIRDLPERELLIGKALALATNDNRVPWLIAAPTMRVPMSFQIATSINVYLAMKAILLVATSHPDISSVAIPGLCTGVGRMSYSIAAAQMRTAFVELASGGRKRIPDFGEAQRHQLELNSNGMIWDY